MFLLRYAPANMIGNIEPQIIATTYDNQAVTPIKLSLLTCTSPNVEHTKPQVNTQQVTSATGARTISNNEVLFSIMQIDSE